MNLFYKLWASCIVKERKLNPNSIEWKIRCMVYMTMAMTANVALAITLLNRFVLKYNFYTLSFPNLPKSFSNILAFVILYVLPIALINYLLIFRENRYKKIIKRYPNQNEKFFIGYFVLSIIIPIALIWITIIFFQ